ncbi:early nodulin-like protein 18 [Musa acuminata AAA Group]|uniref:early nodulin-like protein 18 n=1 Tax=Musa acuminata AAA Group TaxID=214697 RepID=UPI0031E1AB12
MVDHGAASNRCRIIPALADCGLVVRPDGLHWGLHLLRWRKGWLVFRYKKGEDSVLVVSKQDYDACDVSKPIQKLDGGDSVFKFDRSGPFYFISGTPGNCQRGQKLVVVVVMAVRHCPPISSPPSLPLSPPPVSSPAPPPPPFPEPIIQPNTILNGPLAFRDVCCS